MSLPSCRKCRGSVVRADAGLLRSIPYLYCRTCKIEVDDWGCEVVPKAERDERFIYIEDIKQDYIDNARRFQDLYGNQPAPETEMVKVYDPFLKRDKLVRREDLQIPPAIPVAVVPEEDEEGDDADCQFWGYP